MSESFAPGPWMVVPYGDGDSLVIHSDDENRVCFMATHGGSRSQWERIQANAALIAAAPETRDALSSAHAWLTRWAVHVGKCEGGLRCTCGLTAITTETEIALMKAVEPPQTQRVQSSMEGGD